MPALHIAICPATDVSFLSVPERGQHHVDEDPDGHVPGVGVVVVAGGDGKREAEARGRHLSTAESKCATLAV